MTGTKRTRTHGKTAGRNGAKREAASPRVVAAEKAPRAAPADKAAHPPVDALKRGDPPPAPQPRQAPPEQPQPEPQAGAPDPAPTRDFETMALNIARYVEASGKLTAAYAGPLGGSASGAFGEDMNEVIKSVGRVAEYWLADPRRTLAAQTAFTGNFIQLWGNTLRRFYGEEPEPVVPPVPGDKRFAAPEWTQNPFFDFLRQAYTLSARWATEMVDKAEGVDPHTRDKARFYIRQLGSALAPTNFLATNPELLRETLAEKGENLVRGMQLLAEDVARGNGNLKLRQSDDSKIEIGVNTATTPGKVLFRNALIELIQYTPTTPQVRRRPLLIVPPWINKYYVLDLNPQKSFIAWLVAQGITVFTISWVNPDERHADKGFEHYMREGVLAAVDAIEAATGETHVSALGYCVGGTMLAATLAWCAAVGDRRIADATFLATQVDFTDPGDLKIFVDEEQISAVEKKMAATGYLEASSMANAFNMLRPDDLIWPYIVNAYIKGKAPLPFDLLAWNADATRMPAANHSFYLRNCYLHNRLSRGEMMLAGERLDLGAIDIPVYAVAMREDHIAPPKSCFVGAKCFGGPVRFVLSGSGHIAGAVNPPERGRYPHWTGPAPSGEYAAWLEVAETHEGSWWPDWRAWIETQSSDQVAARWPGDGRLTPICDAPGTYVLVKA